MKRNVRTLWPVLLVLAWVASQAPAAMPARDLRVMSFNIRYGGAKDGPNAWPLRREMLFKTIEAFNPDLLGLQECQPSQGEELVGRLGKTHDFVGVPRTDGKRVGEMAAVMFRRERFEKLREGTFWLSETPELVGSKGWDAALPRVATWVELKDRDADGRRLFFFNTHFDHKGRQARLESARLLHKRIAELSGDTPIVVTGDFNAPEGSKPFQAMLGSDVLHDTFADMHKTPATQPFTFHGFTGKNDGGRRIDWVLRSRHLRTIEAAIDTSNERGRYPSDHFPVTAVLKWRESDG